MTTIHGFIHKLCLFAQLTCWEARATNRHRSTRRGADIRLYSGRVWWTFWTPWTCRHMLAHISLVCLHTWFQLKTLNKDGEFVVIKVASELYKSLVLSAFIIVCHFKTLELKPSCSLYYFNKSIQLKVISIICHKGLRESVKTWEFYIPLQFTLNQNVKYQVIVVTI